MTNYFYVTPEDFATAELNGIPEQNVRQRVYGYGWPIERAITTPVRKQVPFHSEYAELAKANGIPLKAFRVRVRTQGWDEKEAATTPLLTRKEIGARNRKYLQKLTDEQLETLKRNDIAVSTAWQRINSYGWTVEEAINTPVLTNAERAERVRAGTLKYRGLD